MPEDAEPSEDPADAASADLPTAAVEEATRLTRLARQAVDEKEAAAYRDHRDALLAPHDFTARVRADDGAETLVLYPAEWLDAEGTVRLDAIEDTGRAVEISLSGTGDPDDWSAVDEHNRAVAERVAEEHGDVHGATAAALAAFASNHYARRIEELPPAAIEEFTGEYFPRNAWPSDEQQEALERSLALVDEVADRDRANRS